jgi:hypothetical protein
MVARLNVRVRQRRFFPFFLFSFFPFFFFFFLLELLCGPGWLFGNNPGREWGRALSGIFNTQRSTEKPKRRGQKTGM